MTEAPRLSEDEIAALSPGIRDLVVRLRRAGFLTTDSGDGSNLDAGMGGALPFRHVMMRTTRERLIEDADRLRAWTDANLEDASRWSVEASYSPGSLAVLMLHDDQPDPTVAGPG